MRKYLTSLAMAGLFLALNAPAEIVFNNFGPNDEYTFREDGGTIGLVAGWEQGNGFKVSQSGNLSLLEIAAGWGKPRNTQLKMTLYADDGEGFPGDVLETWQFAIPGPWGRNNPPIKLISAEKPLLEVDKEYMLIASAPGARDGDWAVLNLNNQDDFGPNFFTNFNTGWTRREGQVRFVLRVTSEGGACDPCDANCDGSVDLTDVEPFIKLLLGGDPCAFCAGDTNDDGSIDLTDVEGFIECLLG